MCRANRKPSDFVEEEPTVTDTFAVKAVVTLTSCGSVAIVTPPPIAENKRPPPIKKAASLARPAASAKLALLMPQPAYTVEHRTVGSTPEGDALRLRDELPAGEGGALGDTDCSAGIPYMVIAPSSIALFVISAVRSTTRTQSVFWLSAAAAGKVTVLTCHAVVSGSRETEPAVEYAALGDVVYTRANGPARLCKS